MKETYLSRDFRETAAQCFPSQAKELNAFFDARLNVLLAENADASKEKQDREVEQNSETTSQFGLQAATRLHEVGIASNRGSACHGEYVPGPCTHRPSHHESRGDPKSVV